jgi:small-conductance mechanosensitive channel/CRP-like cAMP-binding protein
MRAAELPGLLTRWGDPLVLAGVVLLMGVVATRIASRANAVARFICQLVSFIGFTVMLAVAGVVPFKPTPVMDVTLTYVTISVFKAVWWVAFAWLVAGLVRAVLVFKRQPVETQFLRDLLAGFIYVAAFLGIVAYVFNTPVSGLLAASGVVAIVLGLALQSSLGDLFSGVVLNVAKPYHPGDWVILDSGLQGSVVETNWRATYILTELNDLAIIPNSVIAKAKLINASRPNEVHGLTITVRLDATMAPLATVQLLETAMLSCNHILRIPIAQVAIKNLDAIAAECELTFFVASVEQGPDAQNEVFDRVFRHCTSAGIRLAPPADSAVSLPLRGVPQDPHDIPLRLLERLPVFMSLSDEERQTLAPKMKRRSVRAGEVLVEQGVVAPALLILTAGVLAALQRHGSNEVEIFRLAPGDIFALAVIKTGAKAVFSVKALTKAVVYEIAREDIAPILENRPAVAAELNQVMARREVAGKLRLTQQDEGEEHTNNFAERLAGRMKLAFGLT